MRLLPFLAVLPGLATTHGAEVGVAPRSDQEYIDSYARQGLCLYYLTERNRDKSLAPCKTWCTERNKENDPEAVGCRGSGLDVDKLDPSLIYKDDDGKKFTPGVCYCDEDLEFAHELMGFVLEALAMLDKVICAVMLSAISTVVEVGIDAIPGGAAANTARRAAERAVEGAKTFAENGLDEKSFFNDWIGKSCGIPEFHFDLSMMFGGLTEAPDSVATSKGCFKRNKKRCKKPDTSKKPDEPKKKPDDSKKEPDDSKKKPDDSKKEPDDSKKEPDSSKKKPDDKTKSTKKSSSTSTSSEACKISKRALLMPGKLGEDEDSIDCRNNVVHITKTHPKIGHYPQVIGMKCPRKYAQACYHYRSVMSVHTNSPDMVRWTCGETISGGKARQVNEAITSWGATAIRKRRAQEQHWWPWANGFLPRTAADGVVRGCEKDEWPPKEFWPGSPAVEAGKKKMVQRIRLIQWHVNGGAGQIWKGFCKKNAAETVHKGETHVNNAFIKTVAKSVAQARGADGRMTIITTVSVDTAHAVFTFTDWDGLPNDAWHGLRDNDCWPSKLVPEDPGWALLTEDEFYKPGQHPELAASTDRYTEFPNFVAVILGLNDGVPPYPFKKIADEDMAPGGMFKDNYIPQIYHGLLPGVPMPYLPLVPRAPRHNLTDLFDGVSGNWNPDDQTLEQLSDEELEQWIEGRLEVLKRQQEQSSNKAAPRAEALPTPVGEGEPTPTPATAGSAASAGVPLETAV